MNMTSEFRKDPLNTAVSSGHLKEDTVTPPMQANGDCDGETVLRVKRSLRRRNGVDYCVFEYSSDEELDNEKLVKTHQSKHSHQINNTCGSSVASKCDEVTGRWCPKQACRPIIDEAPVFYPTEEEFSDALGYIASIRYKAEKYGICRIVPPSSWNPSCPLKEKSIWDLAKFSTRAQQIDKLQNREPTKKKSRNRFQRKRKRRKGLRFGMTRRRTNCSNIETDDCFSDTEEKFGFQSGSDFTLQSFQVYSENFKEQYFGMGVARNSDTDKRWQPSVEEIEGEYWRIVENPSDEVEVFYGADLETGIFGSGFPKANSKTAQDLDPHVNSGWNLNNFPRLPGSVLSFESGDISGVVVPWLYIGMCFSSFCWHVEDHHLYSLNYLHWGDPKIWYGVPSNAAVKLEDAMKKYLPELFEEQPDLLHELVTQLSPSVLKSEGIPVYRAIQKVGEFILTFPRAYHSGFNCGFNCAEAVNVAPMDWLAHGQCAVELYREQRRKTSISHDKLLMGAAQGAVRALWDLLLLGMDKPCNVKWQSVCGKEGILTEAIRARVEMEELRRTSCCTSTSVRKMDDAFDLSKERECFYCFYDLYLSAAGCECSLDRYACLNHADILCSCEPSRRFFLFRYTMNQLNTVVQALNECLNAVLHWGSYELGLVPPSKPIDKSVSDLVLRKSLTVSNKELIDVDLSFSAQMEAVEDINELCVSENNFVLDVNASLKTDLESGGSNKVSSSIDMDLVDLQHICTSKKNGMFSADSIWAEEPRWCFDLNNEDLTLDCKANIEGWPSDETMNNIKKEQDSCGTSNTLLGSSPEGGSSGSIAMSNKMSDPSSCIAKLFGINLHQHQPVFPVNSNFEGKQPFNNCLPNSGGPISPNPESEKYIIASPYFVEPLHVGTAMFGKKWCNKKAIFPKGFRSRVRYFSLIDPTKTCFYISEVLDGGLFGPLFQVTMEDSPEDTFTHSSPQQSWDLVRERLNQEIIKQCSSRNQDLPTLQPPGSIDGFQMFGFFSPLICQVIESLDPDHRCVEYWAFKSTSPPKDEPAKTAVANHPPQQNALSVRQGRIFGVDITEIDRIDSISDDEVEHVLGPLFHRLRREELEMMRKILVSGPESDCWRAAYRALLNEIEKNVDKNDLTNLAPRDFFHQSHHSFPSR